MHKHTTIPCPRQQLRTEDPFTAVVRQGTESVLDGGEALRSLNFSHRVVYQNHTDN